MLSLVLVITTAIVLASVISTVLMFKLMGNPKVVKWFANYYVKSMKQMMETLEKEFQDLDVE